MLLFLLGVFQELLGRHFGADALGAIVVALVAQGADNLGGQGLVENLYHIIPIGLVALGDSPLLNVLPGAFAQGFNIGQKRLIGHNYLSFRMDRFSIAARSSRRFRTTYPPYDNSDPADVP